MTTARRFSQVDVFTATPCAATRWRWCTAHRAWTTARCGASHAGPTCLKPPSCCRPPRPPAADYRVRIFTPGGELPFAGPSDAGQLPRLARCGRASAARRRGGSAVRCGAGAGAPRRRSPGVRGAAVAPNRTGGTGVARPGAGGLAPAGRGDAARAMDRQRPGVDGRMAGRRRGRAGACSPTSPPCAASKLGVDRRPGRAASAQFEVRAFVPDAGRCPRIRSPAA
jgi:hypothetical protein